MLAAGRKKCHGRIFNIGGAPPASLRELADLVTRLAGPPAHYTVRAFPAERAQIDIGSYHADDRAFRAATGWRAAVSLEDGVRRTIEWYQRWRDLPVTAVGAKAREPSMSEGCATYPGAVVALAEEIDAAIGRTLDSGLVCTGPGGARVRGRVRRLAWHRRRGRLRQRNRRARTGAARSEHRRGKHGRDCLAHRRRHRLGD